MSKRNSTYQFRFNEMIAKLSSYYLKTWINTRDTLYQTTIQTNDNRKKPTKIKFRLD